MRGLHVEGAALAGVLFGVSVQRLLCHIAPHPWPGWPLWAFFVSASSALLVFWIKRGRRL